MNLLSYYKSWSSHVRWWMLLVGGVSTWAYSATSVEAGRPTIAPAVQSAPVEAPQLIEIEPDAGATPLLIPAHKPTDKKTSPRTAPVPMAVAAAVPVPMGPVKPAVPVPVGATRSDTPAPVAAPINLNAGSSRRNSPPAPTTKPAAPAPATTNGAPAGPATVKNGFVPKAPVVAKPAAAPQMPVPQKLEPIAAQPGEAKPAPIAGFTTAPADTNPSDVKTEPKAELGGFAKVAVKPAAEAPIEIPRESQGGSTDRIEATPFPGEASQAERMAGEDSLPPVFDAETARRMLSEKRAADAAEAARRRVAERQVMEAAAAQEAAKLLRPLAGQTPLQPVEPTRQAAASEPQIRRPSFGPELPPKFAAPKAGPLVEVVKPSLPVHTASTPVRPVPAMLSHGTAGATSAKPVSTEQKASTQLPQANSPLPQANQPARIATKPVVEPGFRDRGATPEAAELKRDAFQPAGHGAKPMRAAAGLQLAQVPGELQPVVPVVPPPAVPIPGAEAPPEIPAVPRVAPVGPLAPMGPAVEGPAVDDPIISIDEHFETVPVTGKLDVQVRRSILLRTKSDIYRTAVVDPQICDVVQFTPREVSIIGKGQGATNVTFWFNDGRHRPVNYVVQVKPDLEERRRLEGQYKLLQDILREQFPDSKVYLIPVADKLIVKGQARDIEEAAQIMAVIRGQTSSMGSRNQNTSGLSQGSAAQVLAQSETGRQPWPRIQVINLLRVPGIHQVALRVKIAELNRTAARGFGVDVRGVIDIGSNGSSILLSSILNAATGNQPALIANFSGDDIQIGVRYLQQHGVIRVLSEPTLVTMSGQPATFVAGGEFAVPTVVGSAGVNAVTTDFRAFGAIVSFMPTVLDKDRIRLQVAPEFSQINAGNSVNGIPGLNVRAVTTTVEMREGQTLAIAGLLDDSMKATNVGDLPFLANIFGRRDVTRSETELIILVTPELVQPMEPEEVPPLPGYDVTEPNNRQFFVKGDLEGTPTREYRSTIWHRLRSRYTGGGSGMISGPFGHGN